MKKLILFITILTLMIASPLSAFQTMVSESDATGVPNIVEERANCASPLPAVNKFCRDSDDNKKYVRDVAGTGIVEVFTEETTFSTIDDAVGWLHGSYYGLFDMSLLNGNRTYTFPNRNITIAGTSGVLINGNCAKFDAYGNIVDAGAACGVGGGSGTVNTGAQYSLAYYPSAGTTVDDIVGLTTDANGYTLTTVQSATPDSLRLREGSGNGTNYIQLGLLDVNIAVDRTYIIPDIGVAGTIPILSATTTTAGQIPLSTTTAGKHTYSTSLLATGIVDGKTTLTSCGASCSITALSSYVRCTQNCTITPPEPAAGVQICARNASNGNYTITFAALGATKYYEKPDHTGFGTATTGTLSATAAITNSICLLGLDANNYLVWGSPIGTWTAN